MIVPVALSAAELASYLAAVEAHPFASLLLAIVMVAFFRARGQQRLLRDNDSPNRTDQGDAAAKAPDVPGQFRTRSF